MACNMRDCMQVMQEIIFSLERRNVFILGAIDTIIASYFYFKFIIRFLLRIGILLKCLAKFSETICDLCLEFSFREGFCCLLEFQLLWYTVIQGLYYLLEKALIIIFLEICPFHLNCWIYCWGTSLKGCDCWLTQELHTGIQRGSSAFPQSLECGLHLLSYSQRLFWRQTLENICTVYVTKPS